MDRPSDCRVHQPLVAIVILHFVLNNFIFCKRSVHPSYLLCWKILHSSVEEMVQKGTKVPEKRSMAKNSLRSHYLL